MEYSIQGMLARCPGTIEHEALSYFSLRLHSMLMEHSFLSPNCLPAFPKHSIFIVTTNLTMISFPLLTLSITGIFVLSLCLLPPSLSQTSKCFGADDGYSGDNSAKAEKSVLGKAIREYLKTGLQASNMVKVTYGEIMDDWCVGDVTGMSFMFSDLPAFNENIGIWNVSSVTMMNLMVISFAIVCFGMVFALTVLCRSIFSLQKQEHSTNQLVVGMFPQ
jgi:Mycoplasma protein of unknown function, DUF285